LFGIAAPSPKIRSFAPGGPALEATRFSRRFHGYI
jgi:hypothetical protein